LGFWGVGIVWDIPGAAKNIIISLATKAIMNPDRFRSIYPTESGHWRNGSESSLGPHSRHKQ
jgi:hypothetical protein